MSKHTPTPWVIDGEGRRALVRGPEGHILCVRHRASAEENEADMTFIVRAVNAHDALVEALKAMAEERVDYMTINHLGDPWAKHNMKLARAALRAAGVEP